MRTGALHALAGLARSDPGPTQTVLDVLCSYLRRPFRHPRYEGAEWAEAGRDEAERELQVRLAAQRLVHHLLPDSEDQDVRRYNLDLTQVGTLMLRYAQLFSDNNLSSCEFHGPAWFTGAGIGAGRLEGRFRCTGTVFHQRAWFRSVTFRGPATFTRTRFRGRTRFSSAVFHGEAAFADAVFAEPPELTDTRFAVGTDLASSAA